MIIRWSGDSLFGLLLPEIKAKNCRGIGQRLELPDGCARPNSRANESRAELVRAMQSAADYHLDNAAT